MVDSDYTHVVLIVDRSGSMHNTCDDAQGGINQVFKDLAKTNGKTTVTLSEFDTEFSTYARMTPPGEVEEYRLVPRGATALLDAVGKEIALTGEDLSRLSEDQRPGKVLVYVVTDGMENASREWRLEQVRELIQKQQDMYSWAFAFIGADKAAWYGTELGTTTTTMYTQTSAGTQDMYRTLSENAVSNSQVRHHVAMPQST